jgi:hypothetical protein
MPTTVMGVLSWSADSKTVRVDPAEQRTAYRKIEVVKLSNRAVCAIWLTVGHEFARGGMNQASVMPEGLRRATRKSPVSEAGWIVGLPVGGAHLSLG